MSIYFSIRYLRIGRLLGFKAGIAQLVEQATENRRVPSSNLGPGTIIKRLKGAFLMPNQNIDAFSGFLVHQGTK